MILDLIPWDADPRRAEPPQQAYRNQMQVVIIHDGVNATAQVKDPNRIRLIISLHMLVQYRLWGKGLQEGSPANPSHAPD
jgi:hypothetical protein